MLDDIVLFINKNSPNTSKPCNRAINPFKMKIPPITIIPLIRVTIISYFNDNFLFKMFTLGFLNNSNKELNSYS